MTLATAISQLEWKFYEKGMQSEWNFLRRVMQATIPATLVSAGGITLGTSKYGDLDTANVNHFATPPPITFNAPGWGQGQVQVPPAQTRPPTVDQP